MSLNKAVLLSLCFFIRVPYGLGFACILKRTKVLCPTTEVPGSWYHASTEISVLPLALYLPFSFRNLILAQLQSALDLFMVQATKVQTG